MTSADRPPLDPCMFATENEVQWARAIKKAVESNKRIDNLSDLEYLHHAIVAKDKLKKAMGRIRRMQAYRQKLGIHGDGNFEQGWKYMMKFFDQQPGFIATIGIDNQGRHVNVLEYKNFNPKAIKTKDDWKVAMVAFYYLFQASQPTVAAIRNGVVWLADSEGMTMKNINRKIERKAAEFTNDTYPIRIKEIAVMDPPGAMHTLYDLLKVFLSRKIKSSIIMTGKEKYLEEHKDVFPVDTLPASMGGLGTEDDMRYKIQEFIMKRTENAEQFTLQED